jgi:hypothetical protein
MGKHSDMCGCERCAREWERENPGPVYDAVEDPGYCDGCDEPVEHCRCWDDPGDDYDDFEDDEWQDCGLMPDGQCSKAGSEECDWMCGALDRAPATEPPPPHFEPQASARTGSDGPLDELILPPTDSGGRG